MKKTILLLAALAVFFGQNLYAQSYERVLTEDSSIQAAIAINHEILIQSQNVEFARQRIKESQSLYFPNIDLNLNVSRFNNAEPMIIMGELSPSPIYLPDLNKDVYFSTRLSIWQSLYAGGRIKTTNKLAEINMNKVKNEENLVRIKVVNGVKAAFNECLFQRTKLNLYNETLKKAEGRKIRMTSAEIEDMNRSADIAQFKYDQALLNLLSTIGLELNTMADISGEFKPKIKNIDLNQCLLLAYQFKPEMQMTQYQESIDGLMVNLLSMQRYPTISVGAAQEWLGDRVIGDESSWYVAINANIPIFDGGSAFARLKQGKINAREATLKRSKTEDEIRLSVSKAYLEYDFWKKQAAKIKLFDKDANYTEKELEIINNLNKSFYALEFAIGVQLDSY